MEHAMGWAADCDCVMSGRASPTPEGGGWNPVNAGRPINDAAALEHRSFPAVAVRDDAYRRRSIRWAALTLRFLARYYSERRFLVRREIIRTAHICRW